MPTSRGGPSTSLPDPADHLLDSADEDLALLELGVREAAVGARVFGFHAQQAAEELEKIAERRLNLLALSEPTIQ